MTKKFIHSDKSINGKGSKTEFLIPDIFNGTNQFIGLDSLKTYEFGLIVFTGVNLDVTEVLNKVNAKRKIGLLKKRKVKAELQKYLTQIKELKIGNTVRFDKSNNLQTVDLKNKYYKRLWEEERIENKENWGTSIWLIETDYEGYPLRQIEIYKNGKVLNYSTEYKDDEFGGLGDQPLDLIEFNEFSITATEFQNEWKRC